MKKKVVILRGIPEVAEKLLRQKGYEVDVNKSGKVLTREQLYRRVKGADGIISLLTDHIDEPVIKAAGSQLKIVANYAVGFDNLDLKALRERQVIATNTPGSLTESVAEHTLALTLAVARRLVEADQYIRTGRYKQWEPMLFFGETLIGKTVGVVGAGRIGSAFARMMHQALRCRILYYDTITNAQLERSIGASKVGLSALVERSDVISIHVCLTPKTHHLIGKAEIAKMRPNALVINTARGAVIDEEYLVKALKRAKLRGAALDVYEHEPQLTSGMTKLKNLVMTPHIGSATAGAREEMAVMTARNIISVLSGHSPVNQI